MSYTLTDEQLDDLKMDLGITDVDPVFSTAALNRLYDRAEGDYSTTVVYALRAMLANAHKMAVYTVGGDGLNKQKVFENLEKLLARWEKIAGVDGGTLESGTISLGIDTTCDDLTDWENSTTC